ncbi:DedA family protein [Exiguobacterium acetylicum]|uniref:DedA family protein n=1 Tax=Exiguobacterium acetylicum TaxID=41170 RepID=UPI001EE1B94A|nr:VTT domain-containing protein [Exiguobacterium acetylicum]UKS57537.1 VTT domain-containing protein [Exiguobacterium acetylicum]
MILEWFRFISSIVFIPISDDLLVIRQISSWLRHGHQPIVIFLLVWSACFVCFNLFYGIPRLFRKLPFFQKLLTNKHLAKAEAVLQEKGTVAIATSFFLPGVRRPIHYMAGLLAYPFRPYIIVTFAGTGIYALLWTILINRLGAYGLLNRFSIWWATHSGVLLLPGIVVLCGILCWIFRDTIRNWFVRS